MTWTLQLSPWALPSLLAVLLLAREGMFLWPRRREQGAVALLALATAGGVWALFHLLTVSSPDPAVKRVLARAQYLTSATVPVAWAWFALTFVGRRRDLKRWPMLSLILLSLVTVGLTLSRGADEWLVQTTLTSPYRGFIGLTVEHGPWYWVHLSLRFAGVAGATAVLAGTLARVPGIGLRWPLAVIAAVIALTPTALNLATGSSELWTDLSPAGVGIAATVLSWGLLHHRLLDLGPVARTLVMVELRDPIVVLDGRGRIVDVNRAAERLLGLRPYGDVPLRLGTLWATARTAPESYAQVTLETRDPDGAQGVVEDRTYEVTLTPLGRRKDSGRTALLLRDVTVRDRMERDLREATEALTDANAELERLANTDALTGLANRRHFMDVLHQELERSARYGRPLSLILLDLDHFKRVNDNYGHVAGDDVLRVAAAALRSVCRDLDLAARLGGEELALLLPETELDGARVVAERVRERIEVGEHESPEGESFKVTASFGVASWTTGEPDPDAFLHRCDEALYRAKEAGRNRVVASTD